MTRKIDPSLNFPRDPRKWRGEDPHEARLRLAQRAIDVLEERTIHLNLLIEQTALILGHLRSLRLILAGEVADVSGVR